MNTAKKIELIPDVLNASQRREIGVIANNVLFAYEKIDAVFEGIETLGEAALDAITNAELEYQLRCQDLIEYIAIHATGFGIGMNDSKRKVSQKTVDWLMNIHELKLIAKEVRNAS